MKGAALYLNSIGDKNCRPAYVERLRGELRESAREAWARQPAADRDESAAGAGFEVAGGAGGDRRRCRASPIILCAECREHYARAEAGTGVARTLFIEENWRLVRGLDYYMRTTFEITAPGLGSQNAVCGGGRYDGLVELLGGPPTKGIGFAIGTDRLMLSLAERVAGQRRRSRRSKCFWRGLARQAYPAAVALARKLRERESRWSCPPRR